MARKRRVLAVNSLLPWHLCIPLVLWLSIATFNDAKPRLKVVSCSVNEFVVNTNSTWARRVTPTLTWQNMTPAERVTQADRRLETI